MKYTSNKVKTIYIVVIGIIVLWIGALVFKHFYVRVEIPEYIDSQEELEDMVLEQASHYKNYITFYTHQNPDYFDYNQVFHNIVSRNTYIGTELYAFSYTYTGQSGVYCCELRLDDPALHRVLMTEFRAKEIAFHYRNLESDYEKVKAVHDYLALFNEYNITFDCGFNALWVGETCCNGYSYAFYAIMEELGIPATCEFGNSHAWNTVFVDGEWYNIDVTWDDQGGNGVGYDYFLKSDADFKGHHHGAATADESLPVRGREAKSYYRMVPPFKFIMISVGVILLLIFMYVMKEKIKKRKLLELKRIIDEQEEKEELYNKYRNDINNKNGW